MFSVLANTNNAVCSQLFSLCVALCLHFLFITILQTCLLLYNLITSHPRLTEATPTILMSVLGEPDETWNVRAHT